MNLPFWHLPHELTVRGGMYPIRTDFRIGIRVRQLFWDPYLRTRRGIMLDTVRRLLFLEMPPAGADEDEALLRAVLWYLLDGRMSPERLQKRLEVIASADDTEPTSDERHGIGQGVVLGTATDERDEVFSYLWDMPAVYAAFRAAYRMDLYTETLHLWQFDALFDALPENSTLRQTMALRAIHPEDAADDETRVMLAAQKLACRIPDYAELCRIASGQQDV